MKTFKNFMLNEGASPRMSSEEYWKPSIDYNKINWKSFEEFKPSFSETDIHAIMNKYTVLQNYMFALITEDEFEHIVTMHRELDYIVVNWCNRLLNVYRKDSTKPFKETTDTSLEVAYSRQWLSNFIRLEKNNEKYNTGHAVSFSINHNSDYEKIASYLKTIPISLFNYFISTANENVDVGFWRALPSICEKHFNLGYKIITKLITLNKVSIKFLSKCFTPEIEYEVLSRNPSLAPELYEIDPDLIKHIKQIDKKYGLDLAEEIEPRIQ